LASWSEGKKLGWTLIGITLMATACLAAVAVLALSNRDKVDETRAILHEQCVLEHAFRVQSRHRAKALLLVLDQLAQSSRDSGKNPGGLTPAEGEAAGRKYDAAAKSIHVLPLPDCDEI
jgi:hypothetical protein